MSLLTNFLKLFKWNTSDENDLNSQFDIEKSLNENWDKIDDLAERANNAIIDIQDDIEDIQANDIKQDELIQKLKDNCINVTTEESTQIHVEDASTLTAKLEIRGNHKQDTREGYNLFNKDDVSETMLASGGLENHNPAWRTSEFIQVKELTNYLFYWKSTSNYFQLNIGFYDESKNFLQLLSTGSQDLFKKEFQTSEGCKYIKVSYSINVSGEDAGRSEIMLVEGTEEKPYEEYGATPSLDYPSEVRAVGDNVNIFDGATSYSPYGQGSVEIKKYTGNFLDISKIVTYNNVTINFENDILEVNGNSGYASAGYNITNLCQKNPEKILCLQYESIDFSDFGSTNNIIVQMSYRVKSEEGIKYHSIVEKSGNSTIRKDFNIPKDITSCSLHFYCNNSSTSNQSTIRITKPMLLLQSIQSPDVEYQRYEESSYVLSIQKPMLSGDYFDLAREKEVHHFDKYVSTSSDNWLLTSDVEHRFILNGNINNCLNTENQYCSHSSECITWGNVEGTFSVRTNTNGTSSIYFCSSKFSTTEEFNQFVAEQEEAGTPLTFWYEVEEYELDLTEEQKSVLQQLSELELFKGTNNIITAEDLALMQMSYIADTQSYIDSKIDEKLANINAQILELAGGN